MKSYMTRWVWIMLCFLAPSRLAPAGQILPNQGRITIQPFYVYTGWLTGLGKNAFRSKFTGDHVYAQKVFSQIGLSVDAKPVIFEETSADLPAGQSVSDFVGMLNWYKTSPYYSPGVVPVFYVEDLYGVNQGGASVPEVLMGSLGATSAGVAVNYDGSFLGLHDPAHEKPSSLAHELGHILLNAAQFGGTEGPEHTTDPHALMNQHRTAAGDYRFTIDFQSMLAAGSQSQVEAMYRQSSFIAQTESRPWGATIGATYIDWDAAYSDPYMISYTSDVNTQYGGAADTPSVIEEVVSLTMEEETRRPVGNVSSSAFARATNAGGEIRPVPGAAEICLDIRFDGGFNLPRPSGFDPLRIRGLGTDPILFGLSGSPNSAPIKGTERLFVTGSDGSVRELSRPEYFGMSDVVSSPYGDITVFVERSALASMDKLRWVFQVESFPPSGNALSADFDGDGRLDLADITLLTDQMGTQSTSYDLTGDGLVSLWDLEEMVVGQLQTRMGDVNLDGRVDGYDLQSLADNWESVADWSGGDVNASGMAGEEDLAIIAINWQDEPTEWNGYRIPEDFVFDGTTPIPGDTDRDGDIDHWDYLAIKRSLGTSGAEWRDGDFDGDGDVDSADYAAARDAFAAAAAQSMLPSVGAEAVPEPAILALLALGGLTVMRRRR